MFKDTLTYSSGALLGVIAAHALYTGSQKMFSPTPESLAGKSQAEAEKAMRNANYIAAGVELVTGLLLSFFGRSEILKVIGGVCIAEGLLDMAYVGQVIKVEL